MVHDAHTEEGSRVVVLNGASGSEKTTLLRNETEHVATDSRARSHPNCDGAPLFEL
jgi:hypothetical protein